MNALFPAMVMGHPFSVLGYQRTEKISARIHCITQGDVVVNRRVKRTEGIVEQRIGKRVVDILKLSGEFCPQGFVAFGAGHHRVDGGEELGVAKECAVRSWVFPENGAIIQLSPFAYYQTQCRQADKSR